MGLGFDKASAHWSYSGFNRFREKLAEEIGICLYFMEGFWISGYSYSKFEATKTKLGTDIMESFYWLPKKPISWSKIIDPIADLLNHSDCEGELTAAQCFKIAPRLKELIKDWYDEDYDKIQGMLLVEGMEKCFENNEPLIFC